MPILLGTQFNRPLTALMNEAPTSIQALVIRIGSPRVKRIQGLHCGYIRQGNINGVAADAQTAIARTFVQGRIGIFGDDAAIDTMGIPDLLGGFHPFSPVISYGGGYAPGNKLFDRPIINSLTEDFSEPLIVPDGTTVSIIMSQGYSIDDTGVLVSSPKIAWLNVKGIIASEEAVVFPYTMR